MRTHPASRVRISAGGVGARHIEFDDAVRMGMALVREGDLRRAWSLFNSIRNSAPEHPTASIMLSSIAYQRGDDALGTAYHNYAIQCLETMLEGSSKDPGILAPLINLLLAKGDNERAEKLSLRLNLDFNPIRCSWQQFTQRLTDARGRGLPSILMVTLPKTASETIWNRLGAGLGMPQAHLALGLFPHCCLLPSRLTMAAPGGIMFKEHIFPTPHNLTALSANKLDRLILHVRDPRQILLSWAHFVRGDIAHRPIAPIWRQTVPPLRVLEQDFHCLIDWAIEHYFPLLVRWLRDWCDVLERENIKILVTRFEEFRQSPEQCIDRMLNGMDLDRAGFDWDASLVTADIHLRQGESEEWRRIFSMEQRKRVNDSLPNDVLRRFGWPMT